MKGFRLGASDTIAPTLRSRLAQPSSRLPMPGAKESSTVEWQNAHWMPIDLTLPSGLANAVTPTTAFSLSSAIVVAGSSRLTLPALICCLQRLGQRVGVDLEADGERGLRARRPGRRRHSSRRRWPCAAPARRPRRPRCRRCRSGRSSVRPSASAWRDWWPLCRRPRRPSEPERAQRRRQRRACMKPRATWLGVPWQASLFARSGQRSSVHPNGSEYGGAGVLSQRLSASVNTPRNATRS